ncbi:hypothetical protein C5167_000318, partial [Papaver somniferum]
GREFVEEMRISGGDLIARVRYRFEEPNKDNKVNQKWSGDVKDEALPILRKLQDRFDCFPSHYRFQIYNGRAVVVIKTEAATPLSTTLQVELYSTNLLEDFRLRGENADFGLEGEELSRALSGVVNQNAQQRDKKIYICLSKLMMAPRCCPYRSPGCAGVL